MAASPCRQGKGKFNYVTDRGEGRLNFKESCQKLCAVLRFGGLAFTFS